jgi:hypothetical protein
VGVEPRHVAWRNLQVENPHGSTLEHLPVVRLVVHEYDRILPLPDDRIVRVHGILALHGHDAQTDDRRESPCKAERASHVPSPAAGSRARILARSDRTPEWQLRLR